MSPVWCRVCNAHQCRLPSRSRVGSWAELQNSGHVGQTIWQKCIAEAARPKASPWHCLQVIPLGRDRDVQLTYHAPLLRVAQAQSAEQAGPDNFCVCASGCTWEQ